VLEDVVLGPTNPGVLCSDAGVSGPERRRADDLYPALLLIILYLFMPGGHAGLPAAVLSYDAQAA